ncbi:hypothetical protein [Salimicrobium album]|uniref:Uncharacterized protein n=1 Tax=Salimicrobium album TaxID=50717 RepID=A0A1H3DGB1_9BACI|nr:hypothetical protein [Salimicrobium album]SDX65370.1 hypothetical protein SAMN04488081_0954 [Salimicrobium album]
MATNMFNDIVDFNGQKILAFQPQHEDDTPNNFLVTGKRNPLPSANYVQNSSGIWIPQTGENGAADTRITNETLVTKSKDTNKTETIKDTMIDPGDTHYFWVARENYKSLHFSMLLNGSDLTNFEDVRVTHSSGSSISATSRVFLKSYPSPDLENLFDKDNLSSVNIGFTTKDPFYFKDGFLGIGFTVPADAPSAVELKNVSIIKSET